MNVRNETSGAGPHQSLVLAVLLGLGMIWGSAFMMMKVLSDDIGPTEIVAGRLPLGAAAIFLVMAMRRTRPVLRPALVAQIALLSVFDSLAPLTLVAWAEVRIESGLAAVLVSTMPLFTALIAMVVLPDERLTPGRVLGVILGFMGAAALTNGALFDVTDSDGIGTLAVIAAAACHGAGAVYARTLLRQTDPLTLTGTKLASAALIAIPVMFAVEGTPGYGALSITGWLMLGLLGLAATGFAWTAYAWVLTNAGSVRASLVTYINPVFGLFWGWALLNEAVTFDMLPGIALIASGVGFVVYERLIVQWLRSRRVFLSRTKAAAAAVR